MLPTSEHLDTNRAKREVNSNTIIVGDFNTPLSTMNRSSRQRINKEVVDMKNMIAQCSKQIYAEHSVQQQ